MADLEQAIQMKPETRMLPASIGKTFVAVVALSLVQEGKLGLDDKITEWLNDEPWLERLPNYEHTTVRHLLTHTSGIADHVGSFKFISAARKWLASDPPKPDRAFTPREQIQYVLDRKPLFAVGEGYKYSDTGYLIAGLVIEKASGTTYYEALQERVLVPLGLKETAPANRKEIPGLSAAYMAEKNPFGLPRKIAEGGIMVFSPASEWTGRGLVSTASDLSRWAKLLYEGKVLEKPYLEELVGAGYRDPDKTMHYGLGVFVSETSYGKIYGHSGWTPGFISRMAYFADHGIALTLMVNTDDVNEQLKEDFFKLAEVLLESE